MKSKVKGIIQNGNVYTHGELTTTNIVLFMVQFSFYQARFKSITFKPSNDTMA